jgi:NodT family efflux transporter outer membrane factor (OMF) lipoprotein
LRDAQPARGQPASGCPASRRPPLRGTLAALLLASTALAGCSAVGPDFKLPDFLGGSSAGYSKDPLPTTTSAADVHGGDPQNFAYGKDIPANWWELFNSPQLDALVRQAVANNPGLASAQASLRAAQETLIASQGALYPSVKASGSAERARSTTSSNPGPYTLYGASVAVSYAPDIFGGTRRQIEASQAAVDLQRYQVEATYLTLTANVVTAAILEASLRERIKATEDIISADEEVLEVSRNRVALGAAAQSDVLQQEATLAQTRATLPSLRKQAEQERNALAALVGRFPNGYTDDPFELHDLRLPRELPVSVPSELVRQRPDIRAAEASLHEASARVGVATANMYPSFSLTAALPASSDALDTLLRASSVAWSLAAGVTQPIFEGGTRLHTKRAAEANYEAAVQDYRSTILSGFQDVADVLRALQLDADALRDQLAAEDAARASLDLVRTQYQAGAVAYTSVLTAEQTFQSARINRTTAQATRYTDTVSLFQALGGGWWNRQDIVQKENPGPGEPLKIEVQ